MSVSIASRIGRVLIVGGGRMGQAICAGLLRLEGVEPQSITVANRGQEKCDHIATTYKVRAINEAAEGLPADTIIIAVKPAYVGEVCQALAAPGIGDARVISIAAGVSTGFLASIFGDQTPVVRVMPNTPLLSGHGMSAVSPGEHTSVEIAELVREMFASMGHALIVPEKDQDVVTAISGSGPAYFELVVETLARAGVDQGLTYETALELALQTMYGTAVMLDETHQDLQDAIEAVSSPGGTTIAALDAMRAQGIETALTEGVKAATRRSRELGA